MAETSFCEMLKSRVKDEEDGIKNYEKMQGTLVIREHYLDLHNPIVEGWQLKIDLIVADEKHHLDVLKEMQRANNCR